jgi:transposase InsO family protein
LTADIIELARQYGRYGYRKIAALLRGVGWVVNDKRVERIWRREGLKVPKKQPKRGRLWLTDAIPLAPAIIRLDRDPRLAARVLDRHPSSACFRMKATCCSVNFDFRIGELPRSHPNQMPIFSHWMVQFAGLSTVRNGRPQRKKIKQ